MREYPNILLSKLTTLHLGGKAPALLEPENYEDLKQLAGRARQIGEKIYIIGRGSNLLAHDAELPYVFASFKRLDSIQIIGKKGDKTLVAAEAGAPLARLLRFCLANELGGLEGLTGIPGSVGGACAMNAGSFGCETGKLLYALECFTGNDVETFGREKLKFGYRYLKIEEYPEIPPIYRAIFALTTCPKSVILQGMNLNYVEKKSRQPLAAWSAGCAFKNPQKGQAAGKLLEEAGFRGKSLGGMRFSPKHANFLVNEGSGSANAAFELLAQAKEAVWQKSGIRLEPEIRILP